jgi:hypothetical protein
MLAITGRIVSAARYAGMTTQFMAKAQSRAGAMKWRVRGTISASFAAFSLRIS